MLCVLILYTSGGIYSLKSPSNDRFSEKLFMAILFISRVLREICWEEVAEEILFDVGPWAGFTSYKWTQNDFSMNINPATINR